jgi:hypothetical protein
MSRLQVTATQVKPDDVLIRHGRDGTEWRFVVCEVRQNDTIASSLRYGFTVAPHGDFIGWFSGTSTFTVERI